jgi:hypothetical protein
MALELATRFGRGAMAYDAAMGFMAAPYNAAMLGAKEAGLSRQW